MGCMGKIAAKELKDAIGETLATVTGAGVTADYSYLANSPLVRQITYKTNGTTRMTLDRQYDKLNRLQSVTDIPVCSSGVTAAPISYFYNYNDANQRVRTTLADGSYWVYLYDKLGQVVSGKHYWNDNTPVAGQQFEYGFDDIGNRTATKAGGDQSGAGLRSASYSNNLINELTSRGVTNKFDLIGAASGAVTVVVDGGAPQTVSTRKGEYYWQQLTAGTLPAWPIVDVTGGTPATSGNVFIPATPESYAYDNDGNMLHDGRWNYGWNGENQLYRITTRTAVGPQLRIDFTYDWKGRRIGKKVWNNTGGTGDPIFNRAFLYDGWNLIAELDVPTTGSKTLAMSYTWGTDLSGSMQGAGGVGGLLFVKKHTGTAVSASVAYDGNGNVVGLVHTADGTWFAHYEYGPFGETIRANGALAKDNPFRFSTKYQDNETDLYYYGHRYYNPSTGRWINRDPIGELGGLNVFGIVGNNCISLFDSNGREVFMAVVAIGLDVGIQITLNYYAGRDWYDISVMSVVVAGVTGFVGIPAIVGVGEVGKGIMCANKLSKPIARLMRRIPLKRTTAGVENLQKELAELTAEQAKIIEETAQTGAIIGAVELAKAAVEKLRNPQKMVLKIWMVVQTMDMPVALP